MNGVIKLGFKVRHKITGFEGIVVAKAEYLNGCIQYGIKPKMGKDGKMPDVEYIDFDELEIVDEGIKKPDDSIGGLMSDRPKS